MLDEWSFLEMCAESVDDALDSAPLAETSLLEWTTNRMALAGQRKNEVVRRSKLNQTFAYQILAGTRNPSRDKLIQLAFGLRLNVSSACDLLEIGGVARLLPNNRRDVIVAFALAHGMDIAHCDDMLYAHNEPTLVLVR